MTDPNMTKNTVGARDTWGKRCDITLFMSSTEDAQFPTIGLNATVGGRKHIASKAKAAWIYIYEHHFNDADFFLKADPDTYVIVENLKAYLRGRDPSAVEFYGHRFKPKLLNHTYMSGGPGHVLTRESLRRMVTISFNRLPNCMPDGEGTGEYVCWNA